MSITVRAVYEGGVLRPVQSLPFDEGTTVEEIVTPASAAARAAPASEEEIVRRIEACKTYEEWLDATKLLPPDNGGYDIVRALDDNRRWTGERPLLSEGERHP
jgi:predicted DNA-binding antitoxin AbrB/MazE fold protein